MFTSLLGLVIVSHLSPRGLGRFSFGAAGARWCGVGGQVDAAVDAEVVAARESFSADETVSVTRGPTSGSLALISGSRPPRGDTNESLPAVASALGPSLLLQRSLASHPEFVVP